MHLKDWMRRNRKTIVGFSEELGITRQTLHRILAGTNFPSAKLARKITQITKHAVTLNDMWGPQELKEELDLL